MSKWLNFVCVDCGKKSLRVSQAKKCGRCGGILVPNQARKRLPKIKDIIGSVGDSLYAVVRCCSDGRGNLSELYVVHALFQLKKDAERYARARNSGHFRVAHVNIEFSNGLVTARLVHNS